MTKCMVWKINDKINDVKPMDKKEKKTKKKKKALEEGSTSLSQRELTL